MRIFEDDDVTDLFKRISYLLVDKQWSKAELARRSGIRNSSLHTMLTSKYHPRSDYLYQIAEALEVTVEFLMTGKEPESENITEMTVIKKFWFDYVEGTEDVKLERLREIIESLQGMDFSSK